jgi:hypothetical protein
LKGREEREGRSVPIEADDGRHAQFLEEVRVVLRAEDAPPTFFVRPIAAGGQAVSGCRCREQEEAVGDDGEDLAIDDAESRGAR